MKKLFVLFVSLNLVLFFNFSLWGSYGPSISFNQSFAQDEGGEGGEGGEGEDDPDTDFTNPQLPEGDPRVPGKKTAEDFANGQAARILNNCMASSPVEFTLTNFNVDEARTDGVNKTFAFRQQTFPAEKNGHGKEYRIKNNQLENFRGFRQLFIDIGMTPQTQNKESFMRNGEFYGVESPSEYVHFCPEEYSCQKINSLDDKNFPNGVQFFGGGTISIPFDDELIPSFKDSGKELKKFLQDHLICENADDCNSGICTPQTKLGLSQNYTIPISELDNIWDTEIPAEGDTPAYKISREDGVYTTKKYCQPFRGCLRAPTGKNELLIHDDDYCAPGLEQVDNVCINPNEFVLDNIDTYPFASVNMETCKVSWGEKSIDGDAPMGNDNVETIEEASSSGFKRPGEVGILKGDFCTIPGVKTKELCENSENQGTWNAVSIKYSTFSRLMLGLEWLWSQADVDNVVNDVSEQFKFTDAMLLGPYLHRMGVKLKDLRTQISLDRIVKLEEAIQESLNVPEADPDNPEAGKEGIDDSLRNIQLNFFLKMIENSYKETAMWVGLYGFGENGIGDRKEKNLFELALTYNPTEASEESFSDLQVKSTSIGEADWNKDSTGREYFIDGGDTWLSKPLSCTSLDHATDDGEENSMEGCDMVEDGDYCEFHISDRNCVQDTVYLITNDYFFSKDAHQPKKYKVKKDATGKESFSTSDGNKRNGNKEADSGDQDWGIDHDTLRDRVEGGLAGEGFRKQYVNTPMDEYDKEQYGRTRSYITNELLQSNVHYETSCFYLNGKEQKKLGYLDEDGSSNDYGDHHMEDDCSDSNTHDGEWAFSKNNEEGSAFREGFNGWFFDEIDGVAFMFNGHFARVPLFIPKSVSGITIDSATDTLENLGFSESSISVAKNHLEEFSYGGHIMGLKQQGGLVNPVIPKAILTEGEAPSKLTPSNEGEDGVYNVPRIGNWYIEEEDAFRENIKTELDKYFNEFNDKAKACGKNVKVNQSILNLEEYLYLERMENPGLTLGEAKTTIAKNYDERIEKTYDEISNQIYDMIMSLHFSQYSGEAGTFSLLSRVGTGDGTYCPSYEDDNIMIDMDEVSVAYGDNMNVDRCRDGRDHLGGRPLGDGLEKVKTIIYWLALYKAAEAQMFNDLHTCMSAKKDKVDEALGFMGIGDRSELKKIKKEGEEIIADQNLGECLAEQDEGENEGPTGGPTPSPTPTPTPGGGSGNGAFTGPQTVSFGVGGGLSSLVSSLNALDDEEKKEVVSGSGAEAIRSSNSGTSTSSDFSTTPISPESAKIEIKGKPLVSADPNKIKNFAKRAGKLQKTLITSARKINAKNKEVADLFKANGVNPPPILTSSGAFQTSFVGGAPKLASLGSIPTKTQRQTLQKAKAAATSKKFTRRSSGRGGSVKRGRSGRSSRSRRVSAKQARRNKKVLNYIKKNRGRYVTQDSDGIFGRITKAIIRNGYPIFLETVPTDMGDKKLPTQGRQNAVELTPEQKAARKEMELLKGLNKK